MKIVYTLILLFLFPLFVYSQSDTTNHKERRLKKHLIKIKPFSFIKGYTQITYEFSLSKSRSIELQANIIGLGYDLYKRNPRGFGLRGGYKFYIFDNRIIERSYLKGLYFMPELSFAIYEKDVTLEKYYHEKADIGKFMSFSLFTPTIITRFRKNYGAFITTLGYQFNAQSLVLDWNIGLGVGFYNPTPDSYQGFFQTAEDNHHFGLYGGNDGRNYMVFSINFKLGYSF